MDDVDFDEVAKQDQVFCIVATCGQGEFPANCRDFWKAVSDESLPDDLYANTKFAIFGLGDSSYVYFNEAAKKFHDRFKELGGQVRLRDRGSESMCADMGVYRSKPDKWRNLGANGCGQSGKCVGKSRGICLGREICELGRRNGCDWGSTFGVDISS